MPTAQLHSTIRDFAALPATRREQLPALPPALQRHFQATAVAEPVATLGGAGSVQEAAEEALELVTRFMDAEAGYLLQAVGGVMVPIANYGFEADAGRSSRLGINQLYPHGRAWQA